MLWEVGLGCPCHRSWNRPKTSRNIEETDTVEPSSCGRGLGGGAEVLPKNNKKISDAVSSTEKGNAPVGGLLWKNLEASTFW